MNEGRIYIGVTVTPDLKRALEKAADEDARSVASYVRILIDREMREQGKLGPQSKVKHK